MNCSIFVVEGTDDRVCLKGVHDVPEQVSTMSPVCTLPKGEGHFAPPLLVGEGGWGDEGFNDSSVHLSESSVHLSESSVHLSESFVHLSESSVHLSESSVHLSESSVHLSESSVQVSESSVHLSESSVHLSEPSGETGILYLWATFQEAMPTLIVGKSLGSLGFMGRMPKPHCTGETPVPLDGQDAQATWHGRDARAT